MSKEFEEGAGAFRRFGSFITLRVMRQVGLTVSVLGSMVLLLLGAAPPSESSRGASTTFTNPILTRSAGDPTVVFHNGYYYLAATTSDQSGWFLYKSRTLTDFNGAERIRIWTAPPKGQPASRELWAPELYHFHNRWFLYFTATDGSSPHRHYVLRSVGAEPEGPYTFEGDVDPEHKGFALDGAIFTLGERKYWLYAGDHGERGLNIAEMDSPLASDANPAPPRVKPNARRARIAVGDLPWEAGWVQRDRQWFKADFGWIEAPQPLAHEGRTFVIYSAGHTGTPAYCLGLLELVSSPANPSLPPDPLDPACWRKLTTPVFAPTDTTVTVGHNTFTTSPDGSEHWIVYHARDIQTGVSNEEANRKIQRTLRAQRFTFGSDGLPQFGSPVPTSQPVPLPSGTVEVTR